MITGQSAEAKVLRCSDLGAEDGGDGIEEVKHRWSTHARRARQRQKRMRSNELHLGSLVFDSFLSPSYIHTLSQTQAETQNTYQRCGCKYSTAPHDEHIDRST